MPETIPSYELALETMYEVSSYLQRMNATELNGRLELVIKWLADKASEEVDSELQIDDSEPEPVS